MIPNKLYKKIVESVPIVCVDVILEYRNSFILVKRANEPLKGHWWVVGGRALKGERTVQTAIRKVKEETGLKAYVVQRIGVYEDSYPKSAWGVPTSSVSIVYKAVVHDYSPKLDKTNSDIKLSKTLPKRFLSKLYA